MLILYYSLYFKFIIKQWTIWRKNIKRKSAKTLAITRKSDEKRIAMLKIPSFVIIFWYYELLVKFYAWDFVFHRKLPPNVTVFIDSPRKTILGESAIKEIINYSNIGEIHVFHCPSNKPSVPPFQSLSGAAPLFQQHTEETAGNFLGLFQRGKRGKERNLLDTKGLKKERIFFVSLQNCRRDGYRKRGSWKVKKTFRLLLFLQLAGLLVGSWRQQTLKGQYIAWLCSRSLHM